MSNMKHTIKLLLIPIVLLSIIFPVFAENFSDVSEGSTHFVAINFLKEKGIINGYEDNTFKSKQKINRAEALKMITVATGIFSETELENEELDKDTPRPFEDTPISAWYTKYLIASKEKGIISGYKDNTFKPENIINLAESLKIFFGCFEGLDYPNTENYTFADVPTDSWYANYFALASSRGLLDIPLSNKAHPEQEMTRGYLAEIIYRMLMYKEGYEFGKATFYGAAVQGHGTASGETFDMNAMTSAHKTLPFGTIVEVTNLANSKSVQVKITDRGPYGAGRVLDLTSGAFSEIASLSTGVINVQYKIVSQP